MSERSREEAAEVDPPPPILGRWSRLYAVVLAVLAATIVLMGWVTERFR